MTAERQLTYASIFFAVAWTSGMIVWSWPLHLALVIIWIVCGALAGFLWHWIMSKFQRRFTTPQ